MKKVSVFTVLTCFLAGAAHFPCYAGGIFSKDEDNNEANKTPQVRQSSQPSRQSSGKSLGGASGSSNDSTLSAHPKPPPSSDLDPVLVAQTTNDFYAAAFPQQLAEGDVLSAQQVASLLQQQSGMQGVTFSVHKPKAPLVLSIPSSKEMEGQSNPGVSQLTLIGDDKVVPSAHPHSSSEIPSMFPAPQELPDGVSKSAIPFSSSSSDRGETYEAGGGFLLPRTMPLFPKPDSAGQVAVIPKVCALSFYNYLSDLDSFESKMRGKMMLLTPSNKNDVLNLINSYLARHGKRNGQLFAAQKIFEGLKKAIETPSGRKITFRVAPIDGKPEAYFCLEVEGGVIIFGKIPGQEI